VTATNHDVTRSNASVATGAAPATTARLVLLLVVVANVAFVELLLITEPLSKNALVVMGKWVGLHLALAMILQVVLIARLPWLDRRIGMDKLTTLHRWTGFVIFWAVLLHPTLILLGYSEYAKLPFGQTFQVLADQVPVLLGLIAAGIIVVAAGLSARFIRRRLSYEVWHAIHVLLYVAIVLGLIHQAYEGSTFKVSPVTTVYWWTLWTLALLALLVGRVIMPLWRNARHQFRVAAVVPESDNVVSVHITGRNLDRLPARAGQFFIWRFPGHNNWWQANPFSLSRAPDGQTLRLTAKAVGSTSAGLRNLKVGSRVFAEGPYGAFTSIHRSKDATLLIAGGVGITPIRALLEELDGSVVVLYRVRTPADAVLLPELQELADARGAQVHVLAGRTGSGTPPNNPFEPEGLLALYRICVIATCSSADRPP
jgi:predicted ferric reductase